MQSRLLILMTVAFLIMLQISPTPLSASSTLIAINVTSQYAWIYQSESVEIYIVLSNVGSDIATNIRVNLVGLPAGFFADALQISGGSLAPNSPPRKVTFVLRTSNSVSPNTYQINVQVSADKMDSPQSGYTSLQVLQSPIAVSVLAPSVSVVQIDKPQTFIVSVKVDSVVSTPQGNLSLTLVADTSAFKVLGGPVPAPGQNLPPYASTGILNFTVGSQTVSKPGYRNITLVVGFQTSEGREHTFSATTSVFFKNWYDPDKFGCLIATATYGSELAPEVQLLRGFRDNSIMKTAAGSSFMVAFNAVYYSFSPSVAAHLSTHPIERTIMKGILYPLVAILWLSSATFGLLGSHPEGAALVSGLVASSLIGAFYIGLPLGLLRSMRRRTRHPRTQEFIQISFAILLLLGLAGLAIGETFVLSGLLILSTSTVVLGTLSFTAAITSDRIARIRRSEYRT